ncbi:hypothetical protein Tco_0829036 [Tanacetum coccineum]
MSSVGRKSNAIFGRKLKIDMTAYVWKVRTSPRSLTAEQWSNFSKNVPAIEKAIKKMEAKYRSCNLMVLWYQLSTCNLDT